MKKTSTGILFFLIFSLFISQNSFSQLCSLTSVGFTPINDLGAEYFRGYQGGLYPSGSNIRPFIHNNDGINIANNILPLDTAGNFDPVNGKIVLLSIGMSNTAIEFNDFMSYVSSSVLINPKLVVVNGAQGGKDIDKIVNPLDSFWIVVVNRLALKGVTVKQVQAVWYKEAEESLTDTSFVPYTTGLKNKFKSVMNMLKTNYKNLKLCYSNSRIYAGYATSLTNPEPYAYYNGWTVKWMIEDQINGDTTLKYNGATPNSPWLSWGAYVWADGTTPRLDGLTWNCPVDFMPDGTHPSAAGSNKVASRLFNFFSTDETTKPWFLKSLTVNLTIGIQGVFNTSTSYLNMRDTVFLSLRQSVSPFNLIGSSKAVIDSVTLRGIYKFYNIPSGSYYYQILHRNSIETWSRSGGENLAYGNIYNYDFTPAASPAHTETISYSKETDIASIAETLLKTALWILMIL
ncbi:MAG: hypothetical protein IPL53_16340 [Ignavibacteria bacterium]|nr:hypothetical protein [Ignavibacteria bacterium]